MKYLEITFFIVIIIFTFILHTRGEDSNNTNIGIKNNYNSENHAVLYVSQGGNNLNDNDCTNRNVPCSLFHALQNAPSNCIFN